MKIIFDIGSHKENIVTYDIELDLSKPLPASVGSLKPGLYVMNIRLEEDDEDNQQA